MIVRTRMENAPGWDSTMPALQAPFNGPMPQELKS
jgi:hypothetical protein